MKRTREKGRWRDQLRERERKREREREREKEGGREIKERFSWTSFLRLYRTYVKG